MGVEEIVERLERLSPTFPREAVAAAVEQRDEIAPQLLRALEYTIENAAELSQDDGYMAHLYAMFLLAQFRDVRAYPLVVQFALLPGEVLDRLCGDFVTEHLPRVLASVCGGELQGIQRLIENERAYRWARVAAVDSLVVTVATGQRRRDEIVGYLGELFSNLPRRPSQVWNTLVNCAADLYPAELMEHIEQAYRDDLVDRFAVDIDDVRRELARGEAATFARLASDPRARLIEDTVEEMQNWAFSPDRESMTRTPRDEERSAAPAVVQRVNAVKIGRNEPCPCGSGKKYKKCCGA